MLDFRKFSFIFYKQLNVTDNKAENAVQSYAAGTGARRAGGGAKGPGVEGQRGRGARGHML